MTHSRSPSPARRRRSKSRERERNRERERDRRRRRSRERRKRSVERDQHRHRGRTRSRSWSRSPTREKDKGKSKPALNERPTVSEASLRGKTEDEQEMMKAMGFCSFETTKGKKVKGNDVGAVHVILKRKYRQYMNRKGGFNRPLDFVA